MAPPKPPISTAAPAPKRPQRHRHAKQRLQQPEETTDLASSGRVDGSARAPVGSSTTSTNPSPNPIPATSGGANPDGHAVELLSSSCKAGAAGPAVISVPAEGTKGFTVMHQAPAGPALPGNASLVNSAGFMPNSAAHLFDRMPERDHSRIPSIGVRTEVREVWERGPEQIVVEGSTVRAVYASSSMTAPGSSGAEFSAPANANAKCTQQPGSSRVPRLTLDAPMGGPGGPPLAPGGADRAVELLTSPAQSALSGRAAVPGHLRGCAVSASDNLASSSTALRHTITHVYTSGGAALEGGCGGPASEGGKEGRVVPQIGTDLAHAGTVTKHFGGATDFSTGVLCPSGHGGLIDGHKDCDLGVVRAGMETAHHMGSHLTQATSLQYPAAAPKDLPAARQFASNSSAWGRPPSPGRVGNWSPDYREAFPSIRGDEDMCNNVQHREEWGGDRREIDTAMPASKLAKLSPEDMNTINNLKYLGGLDTKKASGVSFSLKFDAQKKKHAARKEREEEEAWQLSRFYPMIEELIEKLSKGELPQNEYPYMNEPTAPTPTGQGPASSAGRSNEIPPRSMRSRRTATWAKSRNSDDGSSSESVLRHASSSDFKKMGQRIFVFIIGGATRSELRVVHKLTSKLRREVVLGTSSLDDPPQFITKLKMLSAQEQPVNHLY